MVPRRLLALVAAPLLLAVAAAAVAEVDDASQSRHLRRQEEPPLSGGGASAALGAAPNALLPALVKAVARTRRLLERLTYEHLRQQPDDDAAPSYASSGASGTGTHCGCRSCDADVWATVAPPGAGPAFTCGSRIRFLQDSGLSEANACAEVGRTLEVCRACHPDTCALLSVEGGAGGNGDASVDSPRPTPRPTRRPTPAPRPTTPRPSPAPTLFDDGHAHYCFPPREDRTVFTDVWNRGFQVEVKEGVCDPNGNRFGAETVSVADDKSELTLEYRLVDGAWTASEVRVLLPSEQFSYGTYRFSLKEVLTYDSATLQVLSRRLDRYLVLGMFTWDDTENFTIHENYNHEVDVEIGRFGKETNWDVQLLVQPPETYHYFRFYSGGAPGLTDQGGHVYEISWAPTRVSWYSSAGGDSDGVNFTYSSAQSIAAGLPDRVQCLPSNLLEVRLNLWNFGGSIPHVEYPANTTVTRVVLDDFQFVPSGVRGVERGETCSRDCQCLASNVCRNNVCSAAAD